MPDFVGKVSWDPTIGPNKVHAEFYGLARQFSDVLTSAVGPSGSGTHEVWGGGFGGGIVAQVVPGWFDVQFSGLTGSGIGRYGFGMTQEKQRSHRLNLARAGAEERPRSVAWRRPR